MIVGAPGIHHQGQRAVRAQPRRPAGCPRSRHRAHAGQLVDLFHDQEYGAPDLDGLELAGYGFR
jgi:hypothetical protein